MADFPDCAKFKRLRGQFVEAAAKYELSGYRTFIERTSESEESCIRVGRCDIVGWIHWPYKPWRKCAIFAQFRGSQARAFSSLQKLATKAWLWLPAVVRQAVVSAAEKHLKSPSGYGLWWAHDKYRLWVWLLWFDWLWRSGSEEDERWQATHPAAGMELHPFSGSAELIGRWGLDGTAPRFPAWIAENVPQKSRRTQSGQSSAPVKTANKRESLSPATTVEKSSGKSKASTAPGDSRIKLIAALILHHKYKDGGCLNLEPIGVRKLTTLAKVPGPASGTEFFDKCFGGHTKYKTHFCGNPGILAAALKGLNGEYTPDLLFGGTPPEKASRDDDDC